MAHKRDVGVTVLDPEEFYAADVMWAGVELFRWQYGELPREDDERDVDYPEAMCKMAQGILDKKCDPYNAAVVTRAMALRIKNLEKRLAKAEGELGHAVVLTKEEAR